jgi:hypothetical protein
MNFTIEDYKLMDSILLFKPVYENIMNKSLMYEFNVNEKSYNNLSVEVQNLETKEIFSATYLPIGFLKNNTFTWSINSDQRNSLFLKINKDLTKNSLNTINKFFINNSIEFTDKYRQIIPLLLSIFCDDDKANIIRFGIDEITEDFLYACIMVPILLDKKDNATKSVINLYLKKYNTTNEMSRNIPSRKTSKKTSKKRSKKIFHKVKRSIIKFL